jgi:putative peptidoglycan lipid II flippase
VVSFLTVFLVVATVLFWLAAPAIVRLFLSRATGPGVSGERALATTWLRYFAPQLLFIGLITVTNALLNARRRFASVAFSPVLANVVAIAAFVVADRIVPRGSIGAYRADASVIAVLGVGTTAGYAVQFLAQLPALVRARVPLRPCWRPGHAALRTIARLSGWTVGAVVANQVSFALVSVLANTKGGNLSAFLYSYTFMQLPYAVFAVSIAYVVAPELAQSWANGAREVFAGRASYAMRVTLAFLLPMGAGYALVARQAVVLVLAHGHLALVSAGLTGSMLAIFALGLPGFSAYLLIMRAFQAKQDTRSMFFLYVVENAVTVVAAFGLYPVMGARGLVVAWIGAYTLSLPLAWARLRKSVPLAVPFAGTARIVIATGVMAAAVWGVGAVVPGAHLTELVAARLVLLVSVGAVVFVVAARAARVRELEVLTALLRSLRR